MGKLIVIDGLDGSGKETQTSLLRDELLSQGKRVKMLSFPCYGTPGAAAVEQYLHGEFGTHASDTGAYAASVLFAVDRYASFRTDWEADYRDPSCEILCNRYTTSNAVHQLSKLPRDRWDEFLSWLFDLEYNRMGIPAPALTFYLEMPPKTALSLIASRCEQTGVSRDIHEADENYLTGCYEAAMYASEKLGWNRICCVTPNGALKSRAEIHSEIMGYLHD